VTVTEGETPDGATAVTGRRTTAYITLERGDTPTGWRLVTFSLDPAP
jgi:hypothetical protein